MLRPGARVRIIPDGSAGDAAAFFLADFNLGSDMETSRAVQWLDQLGTPDWFSILFSGATIASTVVILGATAALGLAIGSIKVAGIRLGIAGVLFSGLFFGHFGMNIHPEVSLFAQEFGLILFVYTVGMQVGPGFLASLRREGLPLNIMAACVVGMGTVIAILIHRWGGVDLPAAGGMFSGATTNTPSLAAAQEALRDAAGLPEDIVQRSGLGYAVAYPFGTIGIILAMLLFKRLFRVDVEGEDEALRKLMQRHIEPVGRMNLRVDNPDLEGMAIGEIPQLVNSGIVISRIRHNGDVQIARPDSTLHLGDVALLVGPPQRLEAFKALVGGESDEDLSAAPGNITSRRLVVTRKSALGKTAPELRLMERFGVQLTRLRRTGVEFTVTPAIRLQMGDTVLAVGEQQNIERAARVVGNAPKKLNHPEVVPVFLGIALGVILGSVPLPIPGLPAPVRLGMAGGPLLVAIVFSRLGRVGRLVWYMPDSANFMLREVGIVLFLACVGLSGGERFVETLLHGDGLKWMALAALITAIPLLIVGLVARLFLKVNYLSLCGLLAGTTTNPPAIAFATSVTGSETPMVSYAAVYPLSMILRVLCAQFIVLLFM